MTSLEKHRKLAEQLGGEAELSILELIREIELLREKCIESDVPKLIGSKDIAEILNIDPRNIHHARKTKFFPKPVSMAGNRPLWLRDEIIEYKTKKEEWRKEKP